MMIIDFSQVAISNLMIALGKHQHIDISEEALRAKIIEAIKNIVVKFKNQYGTVIIAIDSPQSWRKEVFPYYKAHRGKNRDASLINWKLVYQHLAVIEKELLEEFPYLVINVNGAEGDDVIGSVVNWYLDNRLMEEVLIVSGDKDFKQLHRDDRLRQYSPVLRKFIGVADRKRELMEHIIKGDRDDGIPNILSPDNALIDKTIRQKKMTVGRLKYYVDTPPAEYEPQVAIRNFARNQQMIDLSFVPQDIQTQIIESLEYQLANPTKSNVFNYLFKHRLRDLQPAAGDF